MLLILILVVGIRFWRVSVIAGRVGSVRRGVLFVRACLLVSHSIENRVALVVATVDTFPLGGPTRSLSSAQMLRIVRSSKMTVSGCCCGHGEVAGRRPIGPLMPARLGEMSVVGSVEAGCG